MEGWKAGAGYVVLRQASGMGGIADLERGWSLCSRDEWSWSRSLVSASRRDQVFAVEMDKAGPSEWN